MPRELKQEESRLEKIRKFKMNNTGCANCPVSAECSDGEYNDITSCEEMLDYFEGVEMRKQG